MTTLENLMTSQGHAVPTYLEAQADVPLISDAPQRQGDVFVTPIRPGQVARLSALPSEGIAVVRGEAGGNTHLLVGDGPVFWAPATSEGTLQGTLVVEEGGQAFLIHPEHGATGMGPGQFIIRRQREQHEEIALVSD